LKGKAADRAGGKKWSPKLTSTKKNLLNRRSERRGRAQGRKKTRKTWVDHFTRQTGIAPWVLGLGGLRKNTGIKIRDEPTYFGREKRGEV